MSRAHDTGATLAVRDVNKSYGGLKVLNDVSFDVEPGEVVGLIGPNGAGKTTLVDIICGVTPASSGSVALSGVRLRGTVAERSRAGLGRTFQHPKIVMELTVEENLLLGLWGPDASMWRTIASAFGSVVSRRKSVDREKVAEVVDLVGIGPATRLGSSLTLAEERLLEVGRGLLQSPTILLLDEPFAGSDRHGITALFAALDIVLSHGCSVLLVDHNVDLVAERSGRMILLDQGDVVLVGSRDEVMRSGEIEEVYLGRSRLRESTIMQ